jgi:N-formylglutamate deformylase
MTTFHILRPSAGLVPILLSVPHCGVEFPTELIDQFDPELIAKPDDTDWLVHRLYDFAPSMGITLVHAQYSRWVVDLNRDPNGLPLYSDGRIITGVCPTTTFLGQPLYRDKRSTVDATEVNRRLDVYFKPYHDCLSREIGLLKERFGKILLWDCHSIRQVVSTIQPTRFPDLILGNADEKSASPELIQTALSVLSSARYKLSHNHPFKGGYITRRFGQPSTGVNALQLEMTKVNYMNDAEILYDEVRAAEMAELLKEVFHRLLDVLAK